MLKRTRDEIQRAQRYLQGNGNDKEGALRGLNDWFMQGLFEEGHMTFMMADEGGAQAFNEAARACGAEGVSCCPIDGLVEDKMTEKHEHHLCRIKDQFCEQVDKRYRAGNAQHGGFILDKAGLLDEAIEECVDLYVYLVSLKEQHENHCSANK